jgi:hypothetical protein
LPKYNSLSQRRSASNKTFKDNVPIFYINLHYIPLNLESTSTANGTTIPAEPSRKRKHPQEEAAAADSDTQILWRINWARMERFFRDDLVLDSMGGNELLDKPALLVAQLLLKVGEVRSPLLAGQSSPISVSWKIYYNRKMIEFGQVNFHKNPGRTITN